MKLELIKGTVVNQKPLKSGDIIEVEDLIGKYLLNKKSAVLYDDAPIKIKITKEPTIEYIEKPIEIKKKKDN